MVHRSDRGKRAFRSSLTASVAGCAFRVASPGCLYPSSKAVSSGQVCVLRPGMSSVIENVFDGPPFCRVAELNGCSGGGGSVLVV